MSFVGRVSYYTTFFKKGWQEPLSSPGEEARHCRMWNQVDTVVLIEVDIVVLVEVDTVVNIFSRCAACETCCIPVGSFLW